MQPPETEYPLCKAEIQKINYIEGDIPASLVVVVRKGV